MYWMIDTRIVCISFCKKKKKRKQTEFEFRRVMLCFSLELIVFQVRRVMLCFMLELVNEVVEVAHS